MHLQSPTKVFRSVAYKENLHETFLKVAATKSPIKLKKIKRKINYYDQSKEDIEIKNYTEVIEVNDANFCYENLDGHLFTIKDIQKKELNHNVSLHAYVTITDRPKLSTPIKRQRSQSSSSTRMDVTVNDNTGMMKLSLWGDTINLIPTCSVYLISCIS